MKKIVKRVSAAVVALAVVLTVVVFDVPGMTAAAANSGTCGADLTWTLDDNGTLTISGSGRMTGYGSTTSSKSPWKDSSEITSIVIENGVTSIGDRVFYNVVNLSSVTIADSVTQISQMAFIDCKKLEEITIPDSVTYIQNEVFRNCSNLRKITLPKNLRFISYYTFYGCTALESIIIPDSVTSIGNSAFEGCTSLKSITVPNSVTTIGKSAFEGCVKLSGKIEIPSTVTSIGKMAFQDCDGLTEVTVGGKTPPELGTDAFKNTGVTAIYVPCGAVDAYKNAENWSAYADIITNDGHKVDIHIAAKDATCTEAGNIEYWTCGCGEKKYSGADGMTVITDVSGDPALGHSWSDSWSMDGTNHWHICTRSDCGEKKDNASHSGGTATCQKKAACTVCGREYGSAGAHDYSTNWTTSDTQHWHECQTTGCTSTSGTKNHTFVQKSDGTNHWDECSVCGYKKDETAHSWSDWTLTTEPTLNTTGTAERACSCGEKQTKTDVPALTDTIWTKSNRTDPTLDGTGSEDYTSTDYGKVTITIPALSDKTVWTKTSHKDATEEAEGEDVYESTDYGMVTVILPALDHTHVWGDWEITKAPTLNDEGTAKRVCTKDDTHIDTETLPVLTDNTVWTKDSGSRKDPTIKDKGSEDYTSEYGTVTLSIPELSDETAWTKIDRTDPTLDGTGSEEYTSTDYGEFTITIPKLTDPIWIKDDSQHVEPTEEDTGKDVYTSEYGEVEVELPVKEHTHAWGNWSIKTAPTLTSTGIAERVCTKDSTHKDTTELPELTNTTVWTKNENRHEEPTEEDTGKDVYTSEYGEVEVMFPVKEHTHAWGNWSIKTAPTLTSTGIAERVCTKDSTHKDTTELPELTNTTVWTKDEDQHVDPTEDNDGKDVYTSEYGEVTDVLPALGHTHNWGNWTIATAPTLTETGTAKRVCTKNAEHTDTKTLPVLTDISVWTKDEEQHVDPTEDNDGKDIYTSEYGEVTDVLPALGHTHNWGNWTIATAPTLTETGTAKRVCTKNAEHTETKTLPILTDTSVWTKIDDKHVDPTEEKNGKDVYTSEYGEVTDILPALGHTHEWGKWTITTAPTLTETGTAQRVCTLNDTHIDTKTLPVLTDNSVWTKDENKHVPPTEQTEGEDVYTSEYGKVTNPLDKLPHTHDDPLKYVPEVKPTEDDDGVKEHWHCDGCGKDFEDEDGTKEVTADDLKIGKIKTEVQAPTNVPKPEIATSKEKLISAALTDDEQKKVNEGTDIKIILKVEDASSTVSTEDKGNVETAIGNLTDHKLGQYLDVTLLKKIGEEREQKITETNAPIKVTFEIPEVLRGKAEYSVIRVHDGTATILPDLDSKPNTVTIETDKFSTYALTYKEKTTTSDSGNDSNGENPGGNSDTTSNVDNSSDTTSNGSDMNSSGGTSSSDESNHAPSESSPSEDNGNPSTGIAVSLVPLTAALAAMVIIAKHRRK